VSLGGLADADAIKLIHTGIDRGMTFLDNCWDYNRGKQRIAHGARARSGRLSRPGLPDDEDRRPDQRVGTKQIEQSLSRLLTDRIDISYSFMKTSGPTTRIGSSRRAARSMPPRGEEGRQEQNPQWLETAQI
jgi:hypothetical protein